MILEDRQFLLKTETMKATGTTAHKLKFEINVNGGNNHKPDHRLTKISANGIKLVFEKFQEGNT
ncbi:hypothetical protein DAPPUDRAFT_339335, partial [Daphnia pulex]